MQNRIKRDRGGRGKSKKGKILIGKVFLIKEQNLCPNTHKEKLMESVGFFGEIIV